MTGQPKPFASLSSSLLARKGTARPAMRSQGVGVGTMPSALDDLGWNDMGVSAPALVAQSRPQPMPPVLVEREVLADRIEAPEAVRPVSTATAARLRRECRRTGKAAFTLRLDAERHLRLRLASAVSSHSAQALLIRALDALIDSMPTVETLAGQVPPADRQRQTKGG